MSDTALSRWRLFRDAAAPILAMISATVSGYGIYIATTSAQYAAGTFWLVLGEIVYRDQHRYLERREREERRALFRRITAPKTEPRP